METNVDPNIEVFFKIPLDQPRSREAWDQIFAQFITLLTDQASNSTVQQVSRYRTRALYQLPYALQAEQLQAAKDGTFVPCPLETRLLSIFETVTAAAGKVEYLFEDTCEHLELNRFYSDFWDTQDPTHYKRLFLDWFDQLLADTARQVPSDDTVFAAQILFDGLGETWQAAGNSLLKALEHQHLRVRAMAARKLGEFCSEAFGDEDNREDWANYRVLEEPDPDVIAGMPEISAIFALIRQQEIKRRGVAGAFWQRAPKTAIDAKEWILSILAEAPGPEPYIRNFEVNLGFDAHERFCEDPDAIRRLIDMGQTELAIISAVDQSLKIPDLEPLLVELGWGDDAETVRLASWHLAYFYHHLHPKGVELGFVQPLAHLNLDIYQLFSQPGETQTPYAIALYPKHGTFEGEAEAQRWVDQFFPPAVRGQPRQDLPYSDKGHYCSGYVEFHRHGIPRYSYASLTLPESTPVDHVIIGYRADTPWHPEEFL
jgi:hypothetical protein